GMSTTSSWTPSIVEYSWSTPAIWTSVAAYPGIDDRSTRRRALPRVWPYPRSNGSITTFAWLGAIPWTSMMRGFRNPLVCMYDPLFCCASSRAAQSERYVLERSLLRIQLDDQALVDRGGQLGAHWQRLELAFHFLHVDLDPFREAARRGRGPRALYAQLVLGSRRDLDRVAWAHLVGRHVHALAVHQDAVVAHDLAGLGAARAEAHAVGNRVEPRL